MTWTTSIAAAVVALAVMAVCILAVHGADRQPAKEESSSNTSLPYPRSPVIRALRWDDKIVRIGNNAGDNWPITWGEGDVQYAAYGDGRGFESDRDLLDWKAPVERQQFSTIFRRPRPDQRIPEAYPAWRPAQSERVDDPLTREFTMKGSIFVMLMALTPFATLSAAAGQADLVPRLGLFETTLDQAGQSPNPYTAVTATATLEPPRGERRQIPLFWDGGETWRLRFAPDVEGDWRWTVRSSDPGLDGKSGTFRCVPSKNRGSICPMPGHPHHIAWQDGSPFWWMGDTAWALFTNNAEEKHDRSAVLHYLDVRAKQGFNVVHSMLISEADWSNDGGMPFEDLGSEKLNPAYWQEVDRRVRAVTERGMIAGLVLAWTDKGQSRQSWQKFPGDEARLRYARAIVARYSAFPVFFIIAGEWAITRDDAAARRLYNAIGEEVRRWDPHGRMRAIHTNGRGTEHLKPFADARWNDFGDYMQTYDDLHGSILTCRDRNQPVVNSEYAYYRREAEDGTVNKANSADVETIRACTWDIVMASGYIVTGFGTTYFGGNRCRGPFDVDAPKNDDWEEQVQHVRAFFTARDWWKLSPHDALFTAPIPRGEDENVVGDRSGRPPRVAYWALADPGREYVVYVRGIRGHGTLALQGAGDGATFSVRRFDPRTGQYTPLPDHRGGGPLRLEPPDERDWVFEVRARASGGG